MRRRTTVALTAALLSAAGLAVPAGASATSRGPTLVVTGLNNPRQLAWGPDGSLLIAEAGRGSLHPGAGNCFTGPEGGDTCVGATGSISKLADPWHASDTRPHRVVTGLISGASRDGGQATGPDGVAYQDGRILAQETWAPPDALPKHGVPKWQLGKLLQVSKHSKKAIADIAAVELKKNPDGTDVNPNPYAVLGAGRHRSIVADAGGNDLVAVDHGRTRVLTVFPRHGCGGTFTDECDGHSVPTSLAWGPRGAVYAGELAHFEPGAARVWKVSPWTGERLGWYGKGGTICRSDTTGFTTITGVAFGRDGSLYVSELMGGADGGGQVVRISPSCHRSARSVPLPAGLVVDRHDNVYVSAFSISDSDGAGGVPPGQLWRLRF